MRVNKNLTYSEAVEMLKTAKKGYRKISNNTYLERLSEDTVGIRLHSTYIVKINSDNTYVLNSGGWKTRTTKNRINSFSPVMVYQDKHEWYIFTAKNGKTVNFVDGITVNVNGEVN